MKDVGRFPCALTICPFYEYVIRTVVIVRVVFLDALMGNDSMTVPFVTISVKEFLFNEVKARSLLIHCSLCRFVRFLSIERASKLHASSLAAPIQKLATKPRGFRRPRSQSQQHNFELAIKDEDEPSMATTTVN